VPQVFGPIPTPRRFGGNPVVLRMPRNVLVSLLMILVACGGRESGTGAASGTSGIGGQPEAGASSGSDNGSGSAAGSATSGGIPSGTSSGSAISGTGSGGIGAGSSVGGGTGTTTVGSDAGPCSEGAVGCDGLSTVVCAGGHWEPFGSSCPFVCSNGTCTGVCVPGVTQCSGNGVETCASNGQWGSAIACGAGTPFCSQGRCTGTASTPQPPSCQTSGLGLSTCGPNHESCCTSLEVPGGSFYRSYDGVDCPGGADAGINEYLQPSCYLSMSYLATVSGFRLDKYEITVARFRQFVDAGWLPAAGSGKHTYLNNGQGLADSSSPGSFETGWDTSWTIPTTPDQWNAALGTNSFGVWSPSAGTSDDVPINTLNWYEAYAFCIWDGGFLPSEAEWNYAASGGSEQRVYPWSNPPASQTIDCLHANYLGLMGDTPCYEPMGLPRAVGSESPIGDSKWGHTDLAGNVLEFALDWYAPYGMACIDCAYLDHSSDASTPGPVLRGGSGVDPAPGVLSGVRYGDNRISQGTSGARCARAP
jgi:sulfatase modifying factor 1